jgi:hypothetical protein
MAWSGNARSSTAIASPPGAPQLKQSMQGGGNGSGAPGYGSTPEEVACYNGTTSSSVGNGSVSNSFGTFSHLDQG